MRERERVLVTGLFLLFLVLWLGFLFHRNPRFAGSFWGGMLALAGGLLMLVPLAYLLVKRVKALKRAAKRWTSMRTLLAWHIYAGVLGPVLVLLHTGHKFESPLGIALTATMLIVVVSGFVGRYLMNSFSREINEKKAMLAQLNASYDQFRLQRLAHPEWGAADRPLSGFFSRMLVRAFVEPTEPRRTHAVSVGTAVRLAESIADLEYAVSTHEKFKRWFSRWLKWHIVISVCLYILMALHIWASIHFGVRWFQSSAADHFYSRPYDMATTDRGSPRAQTAEAVDEFTGRFGRLFRTTWRPPVTIHGISTTVFDYDEWARQVREPKSDFVAALGALRRVSVSDLGGDDHEKAFWINVYNFTAMKLAAENYPVDSITSTKISLIKNPWGLKSIMIGERTYSMKEIERVMLLDKFDDPRIVFAVSCAAVSCPDRTSDVFTEERLDSQLDAMIRTLFTNPDKGLRMDRASNTLTITSIMQADRRLFDERDGNGVLDFVSRYAASDVVDWIRTDRVGIRIQYFEHDWGLNDLAMAEREK